MSVLIGPKVLSLLINAFFEFSLRRVFVSHNWYDLIIGSLVLPKTPCASARRVKTVPPGKNHE